MDLHQDGSPYITDIDFQPPSPDEVILSPRQSPFDSFDFATTPPFPHSPSYNGSYHNSPYSNHSELSYNGDEPSFSLFDEEPSGGIAIPDYDPSEYDPPQSSLLMFPDNDYMSSYDHNRLSSAGQSDHRLPYNHGSPSSNDSGNENNGSRSRASSVSSNHISPSPRMDVAQSFENMTFRSPNWGTEPLPRDRPISPHPQKPQSPPRLLMPDAGGPSGSSFPAPPTINAPEGDGGVVGGPRLHIVPATPVSGGGATSQQTVPFQTRLDTLHQGTSVTNNQAPPRSWDRQPTQMTSQDESQHSDQTQRFYNFSRHSHEGGVPRLSTSGSQISNSSSSKNAADSSSSFLFPTFQRSRSKSETSPIAPSWEPNFLNNMRDRGSALEDDDGTVNLNDVLPGQEQNGFDGQPSSAGPHQSTFNINQQQQQQPPQLNHHFTFGPPGSTTQLPNPNNFLSPDQGVNLRRTKSERPGHTRQSRSEDIRGPSQLFPPSAHNDFMRSQYLSPQEPPPQIRGHRHYRSGSASRSERGASVGSWSNASSARASPYPSPNVSPQPRFEELPDVSGPGGIVPPQTQGGGFAVSKQNVTTNRTAKASHIRRKQEATFVCPVQGCGSTFTRSFNLKGHIRSHNEEKPFICKWPGCGKGFARQHDCKRHEQLHTNYRPFTCDGCNKQFARMDALNRHLRSEGGAECQRTLEMNGNMPNFDNGMGGGHGRARSYSHESPSPPATKSEDMWGMNSVAL